MLRVGLQNIAEDFNGLSQFIDRGVRRRKEAGDIVSSTRGEQAAFAQGAEITSGARADESPSESFPNSRI